MQKNGYLTIKQTALSLVVMAGLMAGALIGEQLELTDTARQAGAPAFEPSADYRAAMEDNTAELAKARARIEAFKREHPPKVTPSMDGHTQDGVIRVERRLNDLQRQPPSAQTAAAQAVIKTTAAHWAAPLDEAADLIEDEGGVRYYSSGPGTGMSL